MTVYRWMYWTDWEEDPKDSRRGRLERAWMDGSHRDIFVTSKTVLWPNGLSLDIPAGRLYWVDAFYDRIETILLNGTDRKVSRRTFLWVPLDGLEVRAGLCVSVCLRLCYAASFEYFCYRCRSMSVHIVCGHTGVCLCVSVRSYT